MNDIMRLESPITPARLTTIQKYVYWEQYISK